MKRLQIFLLYLCTVCFAATAQDYMFKHLEVRDGLSNNQVNVIFKDSHGFLWIGTASGLNRYDGYTVKTYFCLPDDPKSLPDSYVDRIQEDADGNIWVHTSMGYAIYNTAYDTFDRDVETWMKRIGISETVSRLYISKNHTYWVYTTQMGLYKYAEGDDRAHMVKGTTELLAGKNLFCMKETDEGLLAILGNGVLVCIDKETLDVKWVEEAIKGNYKENAEFTLFLDSQERLWIYGVEGLWTFDLKTKKFLRRSPRKEKGYFTRCVAEDKDGRIWIGRDQDGIEIVQSLEPGKQTSKILVNIPNDDRTIPNNTITALCADNSGTMWVGTYKKGVSYYNESAYKFGIAEVGDVNCVEDGGGNYLWLGTNDNGLVRWNHATNEQTIFAHNDNDPRSISSDIIVCLLQDHTGKLWAGTFLGGLNCYDGNRFVHYQTGKEDGIADDNIWALTEDDGGNIWIGMLGGGVQRFDPRTGKFTTHFTVDNSCLGSNYIASMCMGSGGRLIVGTSVGVNLVDTNSGTITKLDRAFAAITQVYEDSRGILWVADREGLFAYDYQTQTAYKVPIKQSFTDVPILGIAEDATRDIWASTGGELIQIKIEGDLKGTDGVMSEDIIDVQTYSDKDGLQSCDFNQRSFKRLHTGEMVVGGMYGLNRFRPQNIKYNEALPKVMFTGFRMFGEEVKVGTKYDDHTILKEAVFRTEGVELNYDQNVFTVQFASDNFILPEKTRYFYMLEGFTDGWIRCLPGVHHVTFTNLSPGQYTLRVKATNSDGFAGTEEARLKIVIKPPFWMTTWAFVLYGLVVLIIIGLALYYVHSRERKRFIRKQKEEEEKKREELNQMKFRFFTNVSHELRTPLTLILSPLETLIKDTTTDKKLNDKLVMMYRNAQRLLNQVNQLLDFRSSETSDLRLALSEGDIVQYVQGVCASFSALSDKKSVKLTYVPLVKSLHMAFDEDKMGKIVMNLLSNAFKFTPEGGKVDVLLKISNLDPGDKRIMLRVSDTGIGVKDQEKEHIFECFYQAEQEEMEHRVPGNGIGLSLVKDFVTLHEGTVHVEDNPDGGSVFVVELPVKHVKATSTPAKAAEKANEEEEKLNQAILTAMEEEQRQQPQEPLPGEVEEDEPKDEPKDEAKDKEKPLALIVDDNEDLITFMKETLSLYFRVEAAANGRIAWQMIPDMMPDIVVSDIMMPEMDGTELCRWIKMDKRTCDIPVILLTARQAVEDAVEGLTIGAEDYVTKPFNAELLILRMRKLIDRYKKPKQQRRLIEPEPSEISITSVDEKLVENAIKYVEHNIDRTDLSVEELSRELGMSRVHLYKRLLQITGKTPTEFIRVLRLKRAAQLLRQSQQNVSEVAYQVGFNSPKYFSRYFKDEFGILPSAYQEKEKEREAKQ